MESLASLALLRSFLGILFLGKIGHSTPNCIVSLTTASGLYAPQGPYCSGQLIFSDEFETLSDKWEHEQDLAGGSNGEFQWYTKNPSVTFAKDGVLNIRPTFVADKYGEEFLSSGTLDLGENCTDRDKWGSLGYNCNKTGSEEFILNPIMSARIRTKNLFNFKYGTLEVKAKLPAGDWLWPAIWLLPNQTKSYGPWPTCGEIDVMESRGNRNLTEKGKFVGVQRTGGTIHFGANRQYKKFINHLYTAQVGLNEDFNVFTVHWTPEQFLFYVNEINIGTVEVGDGFWAQGGWEGLAPNPWENGEKNAPYDQEFYIILNLAIGGGFFQEHFVNYPGKKPWVKDSPTAMTDFWNGRQQWQPTWLYNRTDDSHFQIDYVKVWAL